MSSISMPAASSRRTASAIAPSRSWIGTLTTPSSDPGAPSASSVSAAIAASHCSLRSELHLDPLAADWLLELVGGALGDQACRGRSPRSGRRAGRPRRGTGSSAATVDRRATRASIVSQRPIRLRGSSPVVGSSRKSTGGRATSAAARSSRRRMPPEYVFTSRSPASARSKRSSSSRARSREPVLAQVVEAADHLEVLEPGQVLVDGRVLARRGRSASAAWRRRGRRRGRRPGPSRRWVAAAW